MQESYDWVLSCIKSCTNKFHLDSCRILVQLFKLKYEDEKKLSEQLDIEIMEADTFMSVEV